MSIQMKKVLLTICAFFACAYTAIAQVTVSRLELAGTKWQPAEVYGRPESSDCEFTKDAFIIHSDMGITIRRPFYLSNTIPAKFDSTRVGFSTKGRYINEYLDENHFCRLRRCFTRSAACGCLRGWPAVQASSRHGASRCEWGGSWGYL